MDANAGSEEAPEQLVFLKLIVIIVYMVNIDAIRSFATYSLRCHALLSGNQAHLAYPLTPVSCLSTPPGQNCGSGQM